LKASYSDNIQLPLATMIAEGNKSIQALRWTHFFFSYTNDNTFRT